MKPDDPRGELHVTMQMATSSSAGPVRLRLDTHLAGRTASSLAEDVRAGLTAEHKSLPSKYFYDGHGSRLFDAICDTPEYYPTRTEAALLAESADEVMRVACPTHLVELGSGAARKTRLLLEAMHRVVGPVRFVPLDVDAEMLEHSARVLLADYPWLRIDGVVGDFHLTLGRIPGGARRLVAFLGGTIGNFDEAAAPAFLSQVRAELHEGDRLLLGTDLVKDTARLEAAYNDAEGVTAAFNKNVLAVLNRELNADFDLDAFEHLAFYDPERQRVEMHLRALRDHRVRVDALDLEVGFEAGETIHTEISRKFTRDSVEALLEAAGFRLRRWFVPEDGAFALSLAEPA